MFNPKYTKSELASFLDKTINFQKEKIVKAIKVSPKQEWAKALMNKIILLLEKETHAFNSKNPKEKVTARDLIYILNTAVRKIFKLMGINITSM